MGRRGGGQTPEQARTERRKEEEYQRLKVIEDKKVAAAGRRTRGRASLISGSEGGIGSDNFLGLNAATKERLGAEEKRKAGLVKPKKELRLRINKGGSE